MFRPGIFYKGALIPKDDKIPFASCFFTNLDFLFAHTEQIGFNIILPFLVLKLYNFYFPCLFYSLHNKFSCLFFIIMDV